MTNETIDTQAALERAFDAVQAERDALAAGAIRYSSDVSVVALTDLDNALTTLRQAIEARGRE